QPDRDRPGLRPGRTSAAQRRVGELLHQLLPNRAARAVRLQRGPVFRRSLGGSGERRAGDEFERRPGRNQRGTADPLWKRPCDPLRLPAAALVGAPRAGDPLLVDPLWRDPSAEVDGRRRGGDHAELVRRVWGFRPLRHRPGLLQYSLRRTGPPLANRRHLRAGTRVSDPAPGGRAAPPGPVALISVESPLEITS